MPKNITKLTKELPKQLSSIDDIAQMIRDEFDKPAGKSKKIEDSDPGSFQKIALLYEQENGVSKIKYLLCLFKRK